MTLFWMKIWTQEMIRVEAITCSDYFHQEYPAAN